MTEQETIKNIEQIKRCVVGVCDEFCKHYDINENCCKYDLETQHNSLDIAIKALEEQNKHRWIPISERLPEDGQRVICTHLGGLNPKRQIIEHVYMDGGFKFNWNMDIDFKSPTFGQRYMGEVIAWMPLPEPYKKEEKE